MNMWRNKGRVHLPKSDGDRRRANARAALALARHGPEHLDFLKERLLDADAPQRPVLREELGRWRGWLVPGLWEVLSDETAVSRRRLAAASALAQFDVDSDHWEQVAEPLVRELINQDPLLAGDWVHALRPVRMHLRQPLLDGFAEPPMTEVRQILAASILADYADNDPLFMPSEILARLVEDASTTQYPWLLPLVRKRGAGLVDPMRECLGDPVPLTSRPEDERKVERQANAAETLLVLDLPEEFWPRLKQSADPRLRTRLIDRLTTPRLSPGALLDRLEREKEGSIRQAILIGLGSGFPTSQPRIVPGSRSGSCHSTKKTLTPASMGPPNGC